MPNLYERECGLVSVVISTFNYGEFICDALESLKKQTYGSIEIIIIDDCSTDNTEIVVKKWYKDNLKVFKSFIYVKAPRNCDTSWALNIGFYISKGEYIVIHDADDISHEEKIQKQVDVLNNNENTVVVGTGYWLFNNEYSLEDGNKWMKFESQDIEKSYKEYFEHCISSGTIMFRAYILDKVIGYKKVVSYGNDMFFINDIVNLGYKIDNIEEHLFYVRKHDKQKTKMLNESRIKAIEDINDVFKERVSVVITVKNSSETILNALNSIKVQSYPNIEIIIVDEASFDNTERIIKDWFKSSKSENIKELIYFKLPREANYPWNYNIGFYLSRGEYIAFHGDKEISSKNKIKKQVEFLNNNKNYSAVGTNSVKRNQEYTESFEIRYDDDIKYCYLVENKTCTNINTIMIKSDIMRKINGLSRSIQGAEDFEFIYRFLDSGYFIQNLREKLYYEV